MLFFEFHEHLDDSELGSLFCTFFAVKAFFEHCDVGNAFMVRECSRDLHCSSSTQDAALKVISQTLRLLWCWKCFVISVVRLLHY
jgi:hypothetical protein